MQYCPHCDAEIRLRELRHQGILTTRRRCPACGQLFDIDAATKVRQALCIAVLAMSLALTILLYFQSSAWLIPALVSYGVAAWIIILGNKRLHLVPLDGDQADD